MAYCMRCGQPLVRRWFECELRERDVCSACNVVHYENPKILVVCVAHFEDRILLCRRAVEPARGLWYLVSGFMEMGESLEEAAARELFEETGIRVPPNNMHLAGVASIPDISQVYVGFRTRLLSEPTLHPGPEVMEARLFSEDDFPIDQLAFRDIDSKARVQELYRQARTGDPPVSSFIFQMRPSESTG